MKDAIDEARASGEAVVLGGVDLLRDQARGAVRRSMGMTEEPPPPCMDPETAYLHPSSVVRQVHLDLPPMLIGGISALLFQMLHPLAMAGVDRHSRYRQDPLGRLERTARFLGTTTFLSSDEAATAIATVRRIHGRVQGVTEDGRTYSASDPALLTWVHVAEVHSFLAATRIYGSPLSPLQETEYLGDMARVALDLGAVDVPRTTAELAMYLDEIRPQLAGTAEARTARNFVLRGANRWPHERTAYGVLVAAAIGILPTWARRQLGIPSAPMVDLLAVRPAARTLGAGLRWMVMAPSGADSPPAMDRH